MKVSDLFLKSLENHGVKYIFGVPGEENADLMISLLDSSIQFITCVHEQSAAFMADMYGRLTGEPGVCLATLGPGATNLLTGVANANMDHVPLVAVIGQAETSRLHKESHQNMDSVDMYKPVTKWSVTIREADVIPEVLSKAFKVAMRPKAGAVLIELPEDIAKHDTQVSVLAQHHHIERGVGDTSGLVEMLLAAKNPLLLAGFGAVRERCDAELREFMDKTGIYAATTFMGKGVVDDRHPQSLHCVGLGMKDIAVEAFDAADLVICVGYGMVEWHPERWNTKGNKKIVHIDYLPAEVDYRYNPDLEIIGSIKVALQTLNRQFSAIHLKKNLGFAKLQQQITEDLQLDNHDASFPLKPQRVLADVRAAMRDDDIVISDVGAHKMWVARQYPTYQANSCFIYNGFCSMGGSMPGAFTAKLIHPEKHVVAICGDGGFLMSIQALQTAVHYKIPMVVIVWEDHHYGLIEWKQKMEFHKTSHIELGTVDLVAVASGFGAHAEHVQSADDLSEMLQAAFQRSKQPTVIVVPIDYRENMKLTARLGSIVAH